MTTVKEEDIKCSVCEKISTHRIIRSTSAWGSMDLDTRPPNPKRSSLDMWVQICPSCGYCAPGLSTKGEHIAEIVHSTSYQQQLKNPEFSKLANGFLCFSLIQENAGDYVGAGWSSVHAAWACDDDDFLDGAQECRKKAANLFKRASENKQEFSKQLGGEELLKVDLLRRSGQFEAALQTCRDGLLKQPAKLILKLYEYQQTLINISDMSCHSVNEITEDD
ncbi:DUF2225 domain-containing protein [Chloroflexota bacterium]